MNNDPKLKRAHDFLVDPFNSKNFPSYYSKLTDREKQAANLAVRGMTTKEIGIYFGVSRSGAYSYFKRIYTKTNLKKSDLVPWVINETRKILEMED